MFLIRRRSERRTVPSGVGDVLPTDARLNDDNDNNTLFEFTVNAM